jgi:tRNA uridine 5-carbamoylmethylation protein Kti12
MAATTAAATMGDSHPAVPTEEEKASTVVVLILCGLPASGKSSLAKQVRDQLQSSDNHQHHQRPLQNDFRTCHLIEYDALQDSLMDDETDALEAWRQTRGVALQDFQRVLTDCLVAEKDKLQSSSLLILDDNFHLPSMRKQVYQTCQKAIVECESKYGGHGSVYFGIVYVDTPVAICLERNRHRQRAQGVVPDNVIFKMDVTLQPPPLVDAFWEQTVLKIDGSDTYTMEDKVQRVLEFVQSLAPESIVQPPVDPIIEQERVSAERKRTAASVTHTMDQSLRQLVRAVAQVRPAAASHANRVRQECLRQAKKEFATADDDDNNNNSSLAGQNVNSVSAGVYGKHIQQAFIKQVLLWQDWTDNEKLDVKDKLSSAII